MIILVNDAESTSRHLKELIEFMDAPSVCTATPQNWLEKAGEERVEAVFVGPELSRPDTDAVIEGVGSLDPNIPIVLVGAHDAG
jgi:FixJ family two-component response regulator